MASPGDPLPNPIQSRAFGQFQYFWLLICQNTLIFYAICSDCEIYLNIELFLLFLRFSIRKCGKTLKFAQYFEILVKNLRFQRF